MHFSTSVGTSGQDAPSSSAPFHEKGLVQMNRKNYDRREAHVAGTWQNRQGRDNEWTPAAPSVAAGMLGAFALVLAALSAVCVVMLA